MPIGVLRGFCLFASIFWSDQGGHEVSAVLRKSESLLMFNAGSGVCPLTAGPSVFYLAQKGHGEVAGT